MLEDQAVIPLLQLLTMQIFLLILVVAREEAQAVLYKNDITTPLTLEQEQQELLELLTVEQVDEAETYLALLDSLELEALMQQAKAAEAAEAVAMLMLEMETRLCTISLHQVLINRMV
jgi:hypothetical protein